MTINVLQGPSAGVGKRNIATGLIRYDGHPEHAR
jgi:hypothetical protein